MDGIRPIPDRHRVVQVMADFKAAVRQVIAEWGARWPCRFARDKERMAQFGKVCQRYTDEPEMLLAWWAQFVGGSREKRWKPELDDFEAFLRQRVEDRKMLARRGGPPKETCWYCGDTGYFPLLLPWDGAERCVSASKGYEAGKPWERIDAPLYRTHTACYCTAGKRALGEPAAETVARARDQQRQWYLDEHKRTGASVPATQMRTERAYFDWRGEELVRLRERALAKKAEARAGRPVAALADTSEGEGQGGRQAPMEGVEDVPEDEIPF